MTNRKTSKTIEKLTIIQRNRLIKFLESPYHNSNTSLLQLGEILIGQNGLNPNNVNDQEIWNKIYKNKEYNDLKFRKLNSDLLKVIQSFLGQETLKQKKQLRLQLEFEGILIGKHDQLYNSLKSEIERNTNKPYDKSAEYFKYSFEYEKLLFALKSEYDKINKKTKIKEEINIDNINFNLDVYYIIEKLKSFITLLNFKKISKIDIEIANINQAIALLPESKRNSVPAIEIYQLLLNISSDPNTHQNYIKLREAIKINKYIFTQKEIKLIYDSTISYIIDKVNQGESKYLGELLDLYSEALETSGYLEDGIISPMTYRNIITIALREGRYNWTEYFINEYSNNLQSKYRDSSVHFGLANLYFYKKEFNKVIEELQQVNYEEVWYNLNSKILLIGAYYELREFDAFHFSCNSFKVFISRERTLSKDRKSIYRNYIKYITKISKLSKKDKKLLANLIGEINEIGGVASKSWLLEKVDELLANNKVTV